MVFGLFEYGMNAAFKPALIISFVILTNTKPPSPLAALSMRRLSTPSLSSAPILITLGLQMYIIHQIICCQQRNEL